MKTAKRAVGGPLGAKKKKKRGLRGRKDGNECRKTKKRRRLTYRNMIGQCNVTRIDYVMIQRVVRWKQVSTRSEDVLGPNEQVL